MISLPYISGLLANFVEHINAIVYVHGTGIIGMPHTLFYVIHSRYNVIWVGGNIPCMHAH